MTSGYNCHFWLSKHSYCLSSNFSVTLYLKLLYIKLYKSILNALIVQYNAHYDLVSNCNHSCNTYLYLITATALESIMQQNNHFQCSKGYAHIIMHFTLVTVIYEMYDILNIMHIKISTI